MLGRVVATIGTGIAGFAMEQIYKNRKERTEGVPVGTNEKVDRGFETGDEKLKRVADNIRPKDGSNVTDYAKDYLQQRKETVEHAASVVGNVLTGDVSLDGVKAAYEKGKQDVELGVDLGKVGIKVAREGIDPAEAKEAAGRIVTVGARQKKDEVIETLKEKPLEAAKKAAEGMKKGAEGTYAATTITREGIKDVGDATLERLKDDGKRIATNVGITVAVGTVLRTIPHPAAQLAATGVQLLGAATVGKQVADTLHTVNSGGNSTDPTTRVMQKEARQILHEKAWPESKPHDNEL